MAKSVNSCTFLGNVGKEPEVKSTGGGTLVANFSLALSERTKVNGEWQEKTEWVNVVAFGKTAEVVRDYAHKGDKLYIDTRMQTRTWDDKDGKKQYRTEFIVNELCLLGGKPERIDPEVRAAKQNARNVDITDDDIPF
jgi:single-strand DNA-binding protein